VRRKLTDLPAKDWARSDRGRAERIRLLRRRRCLGGATKSAIRIAAAGAVAIVVVAAPPAAATFDGQNGRIVFQRLAGPEFTPQIAIARADGSGVRRLTHFRAGAIEPDWSPDGRRIVFSRGFSDGSPGALFSMNGRGEEMKRLTTGCAGLCLEDFEPAYSPDGDQVAFSRVFWPIVADNASRIDLMLVGADGDGEQTLREFDLVDHHLEPHSPQWSPDGEYLALTMLRLSGGSPPPSAIFTLALASGDLERITPYRLNAGNPDWSPNGERIVFNSHFEGQAAANVFTVAPDGSSLGRLTSNPPGRSFWDPVWSPAGNRIAFVAESQHEPPHIMTMRLGGGHRRDLTSGPRSDDHPDWGSGPSAPAQNLAGTGGPESTSQVSCGEVITADTTLDGDLLDCPTHGIVIGADDITLDLNGHLIDGDGTPTAGCNPRTEWCDIGVLNEGHDGVILRDGSVREFAAGVAVAGARDNRVVAISSSRNWEFGFAFGEVARSVVRDSSGHHNIAPEGDGMGVFGSHDLRIVDNVFSNNAPMNPGLHVLDSNDNLIKGNRFSHNPDIAIYLERADRNQVRRNRLVRNLAGIIVAPGDRNVIIRNRVSRGRDAIAIEEARGNLIARNVVVRPRGIGIRLGYKQYADGHNTVRRNLVKGSGDDGFLVAENDTRSVLKRNVAVGAGDDGFDARSSSMKLARNKARRNGDLGIDAVPGVIDGGGNRASGNGNPAQCLNVACR
jgi:TolB protein